MTPRRFAACLAALALASCNTTAPAPRAATAGYATERYTPQGFALPQGQGCQGDVARFRALMANDYATGNVGLSVYKQIEIRIGEADRLCAAGESARASATIRATRAQFGYPS